MLAPHSLQLVEVSQLILPAPSLPLAFEMAFFRGVFWFGLFVVLTFCFAVLFEYGPRDFVNGAEKEYAGVRSLLVKRTEEMRQRKKER
jgi:hypothetical protein